LANDISPAKSSATTASGSSQSDGYGLPLGRACVPKQFLAKPQNTRLLTRVNGDVRQDSNTADMLYDIRADNRDRLGGMTL